MSVRESSTGRIASASFIGTMIEFYDFFIYGTAAALVFPTVFFPALGEAGGAVASLGTFAVAFLARPLGSALFGHLGDRLGRRRTLIYTLSLMGLSTAAVGLLPGASVLGITAPITLVALRFLQGLAVGGEWGGAVLLAVEHAPDGRRGRFGMYPQLGPGAAFALVSLTFLVSGATMGHAAFLSWGWRVPFLLSVVLVGVGLYIRLRIQETPVFLAALAQREHRRLPLREALRHHTPRMLLAGGALGAAFGLNYLGTVYLTGYGTRVLHLPPPTMLMLGVIGGTVLAVVTGAAAWSSDRIGRRRTVLVGNVLGIGCALVAFPLIDTGNVALVGVALCLLLGIGGISLGPAAAYVAELFPTDHRYTAASLSYNLATILGGAIPPVLAAALEASYGSFAVGVLMAGMGVLSVICVLALPETGADPLRD